MINLSYFYISTFRSKCRVPCTATFCSSLISYLPGMLLRYCPNDFQVVPGAPFFTVMTFLHYYYYYVHAVHFYELIFIITLFTFQCFFWSIITMVLPLSAFAIIRLFCSSLFFICFRLYWCLWCNNNNNNNNNYYYYYYYYYLLLVFYIRQWWMMDFNMFKGEGREGNGEKKVFCTLPHNLTSGSGSSVQSFIRVVSP